MLYVKYWNKLSLVYIGVY